MAPIRMTKEQMREGFAKGRTLTQESWANPSELKWLDELIEEGVAVVTLPWAYHDNFQCERRKVQGVPRADSSSPISKENQ